MRLRVKLLGALLAMGAAVAAAEVVAHVVTERATLGEFRDRPAWTQIAEPPPLRFALLGGSTSAGAPRLGFHLLSVPKAFLQTRCGIEDVSVEVHASGGWALEDAMRSWWRNAQGRPHVLVIYSGHNEILRNYSLNMLPPPAWAQPLARLRTGALALRSLYLRQSDPNDHAYRGGFFCRNPIPAFECRANLRHYRLRMDALLRRCRHEGILPLVIIPGGNLAYPPVRSEYAGPEERRDEAERLFQRALHFRYFAPDLPRAHALLRQLDAFCSFADLHYELGMLHYERGEWKEARRRLERARDEDGYPVRMPGPYGEALRELARQYDAPCIDMDELLVRDLHRPVPDFEVFLDNCHFPPAVYEVLGREIVRVLRPHRPGGLDLPEVPMALRTDEWARLQWTPQTLAAFQSTVLTELLGATEEACLKFRRLAYAQHAMEAVLNQAPPDAPIRPALAARLAALRQALQRERRRTQEWIAPALRER